MKNFKQNYQIELIKLRKNLKALKDTWDMPLKKNYEHFFEIEGDLEDKLSSLEDLNGELSLKIDDLQSSNDYEEEVADHERMYYLSN